MHLKMSSAAYNCLALLTGNSMDPEQTAPKAVWSESTLFAIEAS